LELEDYIKQQEQVEIPIRHYHAHGLYAREMFVPAGTIFVGKVHLTEHICTCSMGDFTIVDEFGKQRVTAPMTIVSQPGTKRVGYAHVDSIWTNYHHTFETEIEKIEAELVTETYDALPNDVLIGRVLEYIGES